MGKVISIEQGKRRTAATVVNGGIDPFLSGEMFLIEQGEPEDRIDANLYKRITYEMMDREVSEPLVKPLWPFSSW
jgi:hypothetical protein